MIRVGSLVLLKNITPDPRYEFGWNNNIIKYFNKTGIVTQTATYDGLLKGARVRFHSSEQFTFLLKDLILLKYLLKP